MDKKAFALGAVVATVLMSAMLLAALSLQPNRSDLAQQVAQTPKSAPAPTTLQKFKAFGWQNQDWEVAKESGVVVPNINIEGAADARFLP